MQILGDVGSQAYTALVPSFFMIHLANSVPTHSTNSQTQDPWGWVDARGSFPVVFFLRQS